MSAKTDTAGHLDRIDEALTSGCVLATALDQIDAVRHGSDPQRFSTSRSLFELAKVSAAVIRAEIERLAAEPCIPPLGTDENKRP